MSEILNEKQRSTARFYCEAEAGYDIRTVQELLGHKDVKTTMIHTHVLNKGGTACGARLTGCRPVYTVCINRERLTEKKLVTGRYEHHYTKRQGEAGTSYTEKDNLRFPYYTDGIITVRR